MPKSKKSAKGFVRNVRDMLFGDDDRLINELGLDEKGRLRLYTSPAVQKTLAKVLIANGLVEALREEEAQSDCDCED